MRRQYLHYITNKTLSRIADQSSYSITWNYVPIYSPTVSNTEFEKSLNKWSRAGRDKCKQRKWASLFLPWMRSVRQKKAEGEKTRTENEKACAPTPPEKAHDIKEQKVKAWNTANCFFFCTGRINTIRKMKIDVQHASGASRMCSQIHPLCLVESVGIRWWPYNYRYRNIFAIS